MSLLPGSEALPYFVTYGSIVVLKMIFMSPITIYWRRRGLVFSNEEDFIGLNPKDKKIILNDPNVERVRRCHLNDLENIVPFFLLGLLYAFSSGASLSIIVWHYRIFTASRLLHTVAYLGALPQPSRAICFVVGFVVNASMAVQLISNNASF